MNIYKENIVAVPSGQFVGPSQLSKRPGLIGQSDADFLRNATAATASGATSVDGDAVGRPLSTRLLQYPYDIGVNDQGHYVILKVLDLIPGKVQKTSTGRKNRSLTLSGTTKRVKTQIALFMPPQVQVSYKANYGEVEMGATSEAALNAIRGGGQLRDVIKAGKAGVKEGLVGTALGAVKEVQDIVPGTEGALEAAQIGAGKIMSKKMEVMFEGVGRRTFSYTFAFIPKSAKESQQIDAIIYELKRAMLPSYNQEGFAGFGGRGPDRTLNIPNTFDIEYLYIPPDGGAKRNNFLNKISTCYLTDMSVSYGGDRYTAYSEQVTNRGAGDESGTPPQRTSVTLNFTEIEIITQEDMDLGY